MNFLERLDNYVAVDMQRSHMMWKVKNILLMHIIKNDVSAEWWENSKFNFPVKHDVLFSMWLDYRGDRNDINNF